MFLIRNKGAWIITLLISMAACAEKILEPEIYLIPEDYIGDIYIVYDVTSGNEPAYEGDARVFEVPDTGVIHTKLSQNYGRGSPGMIRFFTVSKSGTRTEITDFYAGAVEDSSENRTDKKIYVMSGGVGEFGFTKQTTDLGCKYNDRSFYVGRLSDRLEGVGQFSLADYYLEHGYPCDGQLFNPEGIIR
ncbi:MAG: hypothetical protein K6L75_09300 [Cellvibrionaceae bacterium]